jgi:hypothetical protein
MGRYSHHWVNLEVHGFVIYQFMDAFIVLGCFKTVMGEVITCQGKFVWIEPF